MYKQLVIRKKTKYTSLISILKFMKQNNMIDNRIRLTDIIDTNILKQLDSSIVYGINKNYKDINNKSFKDYNIKNNTINNFITTNNGKYYNNINYKTVNNYYDLPNNIKLNLMKILLTKLSKFIKIISPILKELTKIFKSDITNIDINKKDNIKRNNKKEIKEESNKINHGKRNDMESNKTIEDNSNNLNFAFYINPIFIFN